MPREWVLVLGVVLLVLVVGTLGYGDTLYEPGASDGSIAEGTSYIHVDIFAEDPCRVYLKPLFQGPFAHFVQWSPDGSFLIFNHRKAIWMVDAAGTRLQKIVDAKAHFQFEYSLYSDLSPDGRRVAYTTCEYAHYGSLRGDGPKRNGYNYEVGLVNIDGTGKLRLTENPYMDSYPVWSPTGARLAFVAGSGHEGYAGIVELTELYTMKPDGSETRLAASIEQINSTGDVANPPDVTKPPEEWLRALPMAPPVWSPDGERLAFLATERYYFHQLSHHLYTVRADGLELARVATDVLSVPAWSPDGRHLAYARYDGEDVALFIFAMDGSSEERIVFITYRYQIERILPENWFSTMDWSLDGTKILYTCPRGACIVNLEDGSVVRLRVNQYFKNGPLVAALSPDGQRVAFFDVQTGRLIVSAADGSEVRGVVWANWLRTQNFTDPISLLPWNKPTVKSEVDTSVCRTGTTVPDPEANLGLVQDCETLLEMRDTLDPRSRLNWRGGISITEWQGVTLGGRPLRVHYLDLIDAGLTGTLPPQLGQLSELRGLSVANFWMESGRYNGARFPNGLTGPIPPELGNLSKLEYLHLTYNFLSGEIPPELGNLTNLKQLSLSWNNLTGTIPAELGKLGELESLSLGANPLHGSIPPELGALRRLRKVQLDGLYLEQTDLSGCVAAELPDIWVRASGLKRCANEG